MRGKNQSRVPLLVTSELRARLGEKGKLEMPGYLDLLSDPFPRKLIVRVYGRRPRGNNSLIAALPVHAAVRWLPLDLICSLPRVVFAVANAQVIWVVSPGVVAGMVTAAAILARKPIVMNVVGDPHEAVRGGAVAHPLRGVARGWFTAVQRAGCKRARVIRYVAAYPLSVRYPPGRGAEVFILSNVRVHAIRGPRSYPNGDSLRLVTVGSLEQPYKGVDTLIEAVSRLNSGSRQFTLTVVGGGRLEMTLRKLAERVAPGVVTFTGQVETGRVAEIVSEHDVFVLASRTEGLPRAMIEAMSLGLACVGTEVGGIPELLPQRWMCPPDDPAALADLIRSVTSSPAGYESAAKHAVETASRYSVEAVDSEVTRFRGAVNSLFRDAPPGGGPLRSSDRKPRPPGGFSCFGRGSTQVPLHSRAVTTEASLQRWSRGRCFLLRTHDAWLVD